MDPRVPSASVRAEIVKSHLHARQVQDFGLKHLLALGSLRLLSLAGETPVSTLTLSSDHPPPPSPPAQPARSWCKLTPGADTPSRDRGGGGGRRGHWAAP